MDLLLILLWFLTAIAFLISLIVSSYFVYVRGARPTDIFAKLLFGIIVYSLLTAGTGFYFGMVFFIGAHSDPRGSILDTTGLLFSSALIIIYVTAGWLSCSFIVGHLIAPRRVN